MEKRRTTMMLDIQQATHESSHLGMCELLADTCQIRVLVGVSGLDTPELQKGIVWSCLAKALE